MDLNVILKILSLEKPKYNIFGFWITRDDIKPLDKKYKQ